MVSLLTLFLFLSHNFKGQLTTDMFQGEIKCDETFVGELNSSSDIDYYYLQLFNTSTVLFDSCGSTYDTVLRLYNADFVEINKADDSEDCGQQAQLLQQQLIPGSYILEITGFGTDTNHQYGAWSIDVSCFNINNCTKTDCWGNKHHFDNDIINQDTIQPNFVRYILNWPDQPGVAYWNSTLFVIGFSQIHYTKMELFGDESQYQWHHTTYTNNVSIAWNARLYTQYQSSLYMLAGIIGGYEVLIYIDLNSKDSEFSKVRTSEPTVAYQFIKCMAAGSDFVYGATQTMIISIVADDWDTLDINDARMKNYEDEYAVTEVMACSITNDQKYVYIFIGSDEVSIIKYETITATVTYLNASSSCLINNIIARAVTGRNDKMYLHGCYSAEWKTLIFDPNAEQFENETIDISTPMIEEIQYYKSAQLTMVDDNVLLLLYKNSNGFSWYSTVTDLISINFTNTQTTNIWPSDGFEIQYYLNDFTNLTDNIYYILFYSNDTSNIINTSVILNVSNDNCICNEILYNCYNCYQHFHLNDYLTLQDNNIDQVKFIPMHHNPDNNLPPLMIPKHIEIKLQRCNISFSNIDTTTTSNNPSINFYYRLSPNCYSRVGTNFSLNIIAPKVNISKKLIISVMNHNITTYKLCEIESKFGCLNCSDDFFVIDHETNGLNDREKFEILMQPNTIDFSLNSSPINTIQYYKNKHTNTTKYNDTLLYLLFLLLIPCPMLIVVTIYCRKQYMNAFVVDKALVLIIGISQFDDKKSFLPGVKQNVDDLIKLWSEKYKYDVFVCNHDTLYSTKKEVIEFVDIYKKKLQNTTYKAVIIHIISHGSDNIFKSSDLKTINIEFIKHELTTKAKEEKNLRLIKLIFHHGCQGDADYSDGQMTILENRFDKLQIIDQEHKQEQIQQYQTRAMFDIHTSFNSINSAKMTHDSNCMVICGNITGRTMCDSGHFTKCICNSFIKNSEKNIKSDFNAVMVEIGRNLEAKTNHAEICKSSGTLRYNHIRFEKQRDTKDMNISLEIDVEMVESNYYSNKRKTKYNKIQILELKEPLL